MSGEARKFDGTFDGTAREQKGKYHHMALTDVAIRQAKPAAKPWKRFDSGGLHLLITPAGGKLWRQNYRFLGEQKTVALGP